MAGASRVYVTELDGGLDTSIATSQIDEKSAVDILNTRWTSGSIVTKRDGWEYWGAALTNPKQFGQYINGTTREILVVDGNVVKKTTDGGIWTALSGVTLTDSDTWHLPKIKKKTYVWNGKDGGSVYAGSTLSKPGTMPRASFSVEYKGYHIASGVDTQPSRLYFSTIANTDDFTNDPAATTDGPDPDNATEVPGATVFAGSTPDVAQFVDLSSSDGEAITMLIEFQDFLMIGKENSIWQMTIDGASNKPVIQLVTRAVGCVSFFSATAVKNDVHFLSSEGPMRLGNERNFQGAIRTNLIAEKIKSVTDNINPAQWKKTVAVYWDGMWLLSIPYSGSEVINRVLSMDARSGAWSIWENVNAKAWLSYIDTGNKRHLYFLPEGATNAAEMLPGHYYDNGDAIVAYWKSKAIDAGALDVTKRWTYFTIFVRNVGSSADVTISSELEKLPPVNIFDGQSGTGMGFSSWGAGSWIGTLGDTGNNNSDTGLTTTDDAWRTQPNMESRTFTFELRNDKPGENFYLAGFSAEYITLKAYYFDQSHSF